ncbi:hypothetical protein O181_091687 [Austropuccinia psidii MF-1]|uniref:Uncharacterized protein n=1 Tax=Austropuccinia psidii MF-1 TaxID=1389203 RepID=A0A9Q3IY18_9BASI|nr:hypothetical protein [Austropuccinia psidii MF-1]
MCKQYFKKSELILSPLFLFDSVEDKFIPLETQSQANIPVTSSEPEGSKGKGKRRSEGLITAKKWTPIATQRSRKPLNSASIQGKPTLTSCTGKITIINPVVTSKHKLPKSAENKFVQGTVKETLASKGTNQRTEKDCPEPEDLEEDTLDTVVEGKAMREIISTLLFTLHLNRNLKPEDWKDIDQVLQLHQLLKDLFQWSMDNKRFNLASHWEELGASCQKICLKEIDLKDLMVITKDWNPTREFRLLEARETRIRENQATIQAIEEQLTQTGHTKIPWGSQGEGQISSPVASNHSETSRSVAKSHHSSQFQEASVTTMDLRMAYQPTVLLWPIGHIHHKWPIWPPHHLMDHLWPFVFWGLHGPSPQYRSHSGNLCSNGYFWSFPSKPGEMAQMAVFGHLGS